MLKSPYVTIQAATFAVAISLVAITAPQAAPYNASHIAVDPIVEKSGSRLTGKERLRRLFRQHSRVGNPITQSVRDATGDPNISVIDNRFGDPFDTYSCSYF